MTIKNNIFIAIFILLLLILTIIILKKANLHIFTAKGKAEYIKVKGLKNYIEQYSLMKEKDIEYHILWDKYLSYAVAFGIPNIITNKINSLMMDTNNVLQKIDEILRF